MASPVEEIKARLDVAEFIGRDVRLTRSGRYLKGLCPFHTEKTPSFFVFTDRGTYKCFGCGEGGDLFSYVMRRDNAEFPEALGALATEAGVELRGERTDPETRSRRKRLGSALTEAARVLHELLLNAPAAASARGYLEQRGVTGASTTAFQLGYAPAHGSPVTKRLRELGVEPEIIAATGVARDDGGELRDYFFDRLVFPIVDRRGDVVGFGARALGDAEPKYLNTRESDVFTKGHHLYGYHLARDAIRQDGTAVIVEGYMDAIAAHEHGFANTVASMGTALTGQQATLLRSSGAKRIILALDADTAGAAATRRGVDVLRESGEYESEAAVDFRGLVRHEDRLATDIAIVELPEGEDPDSLIRSDGPGWTSLLADPTPLADFYFSWAMREHDLSTLAGRQQAVRELVPVVAELRDTVVRAHYFSRLADLSRVPQDELRAMAASARRRRPRAAQAETPTGGTAAADPLEEGLVEYALRAPPEYLEMVARLDPSFVSDPGLRHLLAVIVRMIQVRGGLDWDAVLAELDETSAARLVRIREHARQAPQLEADAFVRALQSAALRLRRRRLEVDWNEATHLRSAGDAVAESPDFRARVERLEQERLNVFRAERELSVLIGGRPA